MDAYCGSVSFDAREAMFCFPQKKKRDFLWMKMRWLIVMDWIIWILQFAFAACVFFSFSDWFFDEEYAVD